MEKFGETFVKPRNIRWNIQEIYPDLDPPAVEALSKTILRNFGHHVAEMFHISSFRNSKSGTLIDYSTPEGVVFDAKGPAIYIGIHAGSWELCPLIFAKKNEPFTTIYSQNEHPILNNFLMHQRLQTGAKYIEKQSALKPCFQALKQKEAIGLLIDQRVDQGIDVNFFGRTTALTRMPAMLAMKFDCPIIPFDVVRLKPGHLRVVIKDAIIPTGEKGDEAEAKLAQKIADATQSAIVRNVDSWFCTKLRWRRSDLERVRNKKVTSDTPAQVKPKASPADL